MKTWPDWVEDLKGQYLSGSSSFFVLHGNVDDVVGNQTAAGYANEPLADFMAKRLFHGYDLVLHYDLGRGLRPYPGGDPQRLTRMNQLLNRLLGQSADLPREPGHVLRVLDHLANLILVGGAERTAPKTAFLFDYAEMICPPGDRSAENLAFFLNWARSPLVKRINMVFILMAHSLAQLHPALIQSGYTSEILVPMPTLEERQRHIEHVFPHLAGDAVRLARLSSGLTLSNIENLLRLTQADGSRPEPVALPAEPREIAGAQAESPPGPPAPAVPAASAGDHMLVKVKKQLIESQCPGLIEFIEPKLDLSLVAGHFAAKKRLSDDAALIRRGELDAVPMGYLICGPVGVGKTFIALCYAGTVGIPCVAIKNFRSKYVGETEANLEKILRVLSELGPVAVIIDEADAAVGNRGASGDSGTSARVFAQLASQMGDTRYRGRMIWFLLTCRPDLLPVDLKRQGRCEEHIPLFYPETTEERKDMFLAMGRKLKLNLTPDMLPALEVSRSLSGADIESLLTRARREALILGQSLSREILGEAFENFNSPRGPEHELQWLAAILECSDLRYLPEKVRLAVSEEGGLGRLTSRFNQLRAALDS